MKKPVDGKASMTGSATPNGLLDDPRVHSAWALYISKFISAYFKKGVPIWAVTPQNEPEFPAPWEACSYNSTGESDFINDYLGPTLKATHPDVLILVLSYFVNGSDLFK
jgi:glucosylceramidase